MKSQKEPNVNQTLENSKSTAQPLPLAAIEDAVKSIRFGVVQIIVQDGRVIQIDKTEKIRLA